MTLLQDPANVTSVFRDLIDLLLMEAK